jgi:aspartyl-tRNA(Asn)/glutamyl-tRNA(Gln) amidotransferase subunit A
MYLEDIFTVPINLVGIPGISIPSGIKKVNDKELPIGIQFVSDYGREDKLFSVSKKFLEEN